MALHDKLDQIRNVEIRDLCARQQEQLTMLANFIGATVRRADRSEVF